MSFPRKRNNEAWALAGFVSVLWTMLTPIVAMELFGLWWFCLLAAGWTPIAVSEASYRAKFWYWRNRTAEGRMQREEQEAWRRLEKAQRWAAHQKQLAKIEAQIDKTLNLEDL